MRPIERSFPPYFLEHRAEACTTRVLRVENAPIWFLQCPGGWSVNSIVLEGPDGLIVYDTGVGREQGEAIADEIRKLTPKPIRAIIYSHHHVDHCQGTDALVSKEQVESGEVQVIAWESFSKEYADENRVVGPIMSHRAAYMYGVLLPPEEQAYTGLGPRFAGGTVGSFIEPNHLLTTDTELEIAGLRVQIFRTGGEASSEMGLHLPDARAAIIADEVYAAMANLYTLRGAKFRDANRWAAASDRVLEMDLDVLLGCHMAPIYGRDEIRRVLTIYRDAIQYNHDQAVRRVLTGATPEELRTELTELPAFLDLPPYTREMYGRVAANAAQQFTGYLGWFDGDATSLAPTPRAERSRRTIALMGGRDRVLEEASKALDQDDPQWCAELATLVLGTDSEDTDARSLKAAGLRLLGYGERNATWRNWYLTGARELDGEADPVTIGALARATALPAALGGAPLLDSLRFTVEPDRAQDRHEFVGVHVPDSGETWSLELRHSILVVHEGDRAENAGMVSIPVAALAAFVAGRQTFAQVLDEAGATVRSGSPDDVRRFFDVFDTAAPSRGFHSR